MTESTMPLTNAGQAVVTAVARQIERMTKEEVQELVEKSLLDLHKENTQLKERIAEQAKIIEALEADKVRLYYQIGRLQFSEKDWEDFDPKDFTVPVEGMLADMDKLLNQSGETGRG